MWRPVVGFEGLYEVSDAGRIRNARTLYVLKSRKDSDGYLINDIWRGSPVVKVTVKVHREVAKAFIPNPLNLPEVNHLDGVRDNARKSNLEWATVSTNRLHAFRELGRTRSGEKAVEGRRGSEIVRFPSLMAAHRAGFNRAGIQKCFRGEYATHHGFIWRTVNV